MSEAAARSDLMALKPCPFCGGNWLVAKEPHDNHPVAGMWYLYHDNPRCEFDTPSRHFETREAAVNAWNTRAASQPDREAVKEFIASASFASRSSLDSDTIFCEIYTPGYQPAKKGSFGFFVKELRAILSLLSEPSEVIQPSISDCGQSNEQSAQGLSPAFGIIDPDYARIFTIARCVAWAEGYAIAMHGSFTRDLDLIAVPWARHACEPEHLARRIESAAGLKISVHPKNDKPFGRLVWTMTLPNFGDPRFVDLSIIPRSSIEQDGQAELLEEEQRMIDLAWETHKAARPIDASTLAEEIRIQMNVRKTCVVSGVEALAKGLIEAFTITQLTKTPSADHDAGNLRGLAEPTTRDSSESTTGGAAPDHTTMEERA